jgi:hypothetical protein
MIARELKTLIDLASRVFDSPGSFTAVDLVPFHLHTLHSGSVGVSCAGFKRTGSEGDHGEAEGENKSDNAHGVYLN